MCICVDIDIDIDLQTMNVLKKRRNKVYCSILAQQQTKKHIISFTQKECMEPTPFERNRKSQGALWTAEWGWEPPLSHQSPCYLVPAQWSGSHEDFLPLQSNLYSFYHNRAWVNWHHLGEQQCFEKVGRIMVIMNCLHQIFCFPTVSVYKKLWFPFKESKNEESGFA